VLSESFDWTFDGVTETVDRGFVFSKTILVYSSRDQLAVEQLDVYHSYSPVAL